MSESGSYFGVFSLKRTTNCWAINVYIECNFKKKGYNFVVTLNLLFLCLLQNYLVNNVRLFIGVSHYKIYSPADDAKA